MSLRGILLGLILLTMALTDLHGWIIPDRLQIAGCLVFLVTAFFWPEPVSHILRGLLFGTVLGGGMLLLSLLFDRLTGKESRGAFVLFDLKLSAWTRVRGTAQIAAASLWPFHCGGVLYYDPLWNCDHPLVYGTVLNGVLCTR